MPEIEAGLGGRARLVVLTKGPGDVEDPAVVAALAGVAPERSGIEVVMSGSAFTDYRAAAPFFAVVDPHGGAAPKEWRGESTRPCVPRLAGLARD